MSSKVLCSLEYPVSLETITQSGSTLETSESSKILCSFEYPVSPDEFSESGSILDTSEFDSECGIGLAELGIASFSSSVCDIAWFV